MGKVRPTLFPLLKGKVDKVVFCRRGGGVYTREWVTPNDPKTPAQLTHRELVRQAGIAWRAQDVPAGRHAFVESRRRRRRPAGVDR